MCRLRMPAASDESRKRLRSLYRKKSGAGGDTLVFFNKADPDGERSTYYFEDFAKCVFRKQKKPVNKPEKEASGIGRRDPVPELFSDRHCVLSRLSAECGAA